MVEKLKNLRKDYYTINDLENIFAIRRPSLLVALSRLKKAGQIVRLSQGLYQLAEEGTDLGKIATQIYEPAYISFETALSKYGILSQIPYALTLATINRPKKMIIQERLVEYRRIKKEFFFGFGLEGGVYLASPEKALLDSLYFMSKGRLSLDFGELDIKELDRKKFIKMAQKFPSAVQKLAKKIL